MDKTKRPALVAGNWKMNSHKAQTGDLIKKLRPLAADADCIVAICPPFTSLDAAARALKGSKICLGAQNCHWESNGAFTGEISARMLADAGAEYVILGHSERRMYFFETDEIIKMKIKAGLDAGLNIILCVGETEEQQKSGDTIDVIYRQMAQALKEVSARSLPAVSIAYEPVWAIGTGNTASPKLAGETCAFIRGVLAGMYGEDAADRVSIIYGGSMTEHNAADLFSQYDIDGGLVGTASLSHESFSKIVAAASR
jgi:triosephosphate isomerase